MAERTIPPMQHAPHADNCASVTGVSILTGRPRRTCDCGAFYPFPTATAESETRRLDAENAELILRAQAAEAALESCNRARRAAEEACAAAEERARGLEEALRAIHSAVRSDEHHQYHDARAWLDARDIYNGDLEGSFADGDAVLEAIVTAALSPAAEGEKADG